MISLLVMVRIADGHAAPEGILAEGPQIGSVVQ